MTIDKNIYKLQLHESTKTNTILNTNIRYFVTRVAGGWLYESNQENASPVFVPYCEDMKDHLDGVLT